MEKSANISNRNCQGSLAGLTRMKASQDLLHSIVIEESIQCRPLHTISRKECTASICKTTEKLNGMMPTTDARSW